MGGAIHVGTPGSVNGTDTDDPHCPATLINDFAGQALCRQRSHGLTHHHAWSKPRRAAKIRKLRSRWPTSAFP